MIGKTVSHYTILEEIGAGGMGIVYKAQDTQLKRHVALKFLPPELIRDEEARERFIHEARSASALDHPNICTIYEIGRTDDDRMFIAMGFYQGETLKEKIARGPLQSREAIDIIEQIARGLAKAHEKGIVHRDIKPANIFITEEGLVKILDFGLAKLSGQTKLTKAGSTLGTVSYMSPEQAQGEEVDHRTDIWSLGILLYEMLTGQLPFKGDYQQAVIYSIINEKPKSLEEIAEVDPELDRIVHRMLQKDPRSRYSSVDELTDDLEVQKKASEPVADVSVFEPLKRLIRKPRYAVPAVALVILLSALAFWFFDRRAEIRWAEEKSLTEIEQFLDAENYPEAFKRVRKAEKYMSENPDFAELAKEAVTRLTVLTDPPGATVSTRLYSDLGGEWEELGETPIDSIPMPGWTIYRMKIVKTGYENVIAVVSTAFDTVSRTLFVAKTAPPGMVYVEGYSYEWPCYFLQESHGFFMDRYEVTNRQYKTFLDDGGYSNPEYWKHAFVKEGVTLSREQAMSEFIDRTGQPGPAAWEAGDYPEGQDDFPVSGIGWYEAAAYAEYSGKSLPTTWHWASGAGVFMDPFIRNSYYSHVVPFSNFAGNGPEPVGKSAGINMYGACDMAGNVREWCFNQTQAGHNIICGGAWDDAEYMYSSWSQLPPFDRSAKNGMRCVKYVDPETIHEKSFQSIEFRERTDYSTMTPVADEIFRIYKNQFLYDKKALDARVEDRDDSRDDWTMETATFNAAYGNERVIAYLYLPKNAIPPYQTLIFFPGVGAVYTEKELKDMSWTIWFIDYFMKSGRAVMLPVYKGTSVRNDGLTGRMANFNESHEFTEWLIAWSKDLSRSIDYLETRSDIDTSKLGFLGWSWGGETGAVIPAVENRLKVSLLVLGGFCAPAFPEADAVNYLPRIKIPVLMLNGRYDIWRPYETNLKPFYELLGTPEKDKRLILYDTDHYIPKRDMIKENLAWLDKYFGPANKGVR